MNTKIKKLMDQMNTVQNELELVKVPSQTKIDALKVKIQDEYNKVFEMSIKLKKDLKALEQSKEYGSDERGIYSWTRLTYDIGSALQHRIYLVEYLSEYHHAIIDFKNSALQSYVGGCIIINEEGDVYSADDGINPDKWIVKASEYKIDAYFLDTAKRNELIEAWMHKNRYFPGVFTMDRYGNVFLVNTTKPKGKKSKAGV